MNLFGDWHSGTIFKEDASVATDGGYIRRLLRTSSVFHSERKYVSVNSLEIDANVGQAAVASGQGSAPQMVLKYSLDGGNTQEGEERIDLGALGQYDNRVRIHNLGCARDWTITMEITDPIDVIIMQAEVKGSFGTF